MEPGVARSLSLMEERSDQAEDGGGILLEVDWTLDDLEATARGEGGRD